MLPKWLSPNTRLFSCRLRLMIGLVGVLLVLSPGVQAGGSCPDCPPMAELCVDLFIVGRMENGKVEVGTVQNRFDPKTRMYHYKHPSRFDPAQFRNGILDLSEGTNPSAGARNTRDMVQHLFDYINQTWEGCCIRFKVRKIIALYLPGLSPRIRKLFPAPPSLTPLQRFAESLTDQKCNKLFLIPDYHDPKSPDGVGRGQEPGTTSVAGIASFQRQHAHVPSHELGHNFGLEHYTPATKARAYEIERNIMESVHSKAARWVLNADQCKRVKAHLQKTGRWTAADEKKMREATRKLWSEIENLVKKVKASKTNTGPSSPGRSPQKPQTDSLENKIKQLREKIKNLTKQKKKFERKAEAHQNMADNYRANGMEGPAESYDKKARDAWKKARDVKKKIKKLKKQLRQLRREQRLRELKAKYSTPATPKPTAPKTTPTTSPEDELRRKLIEWRNRCCTRPKDRSGTLALENAETLLKDLEASVKDKSLRKTLKKVRDDIKKARRDLRTSHRADALQRTEHARMKLAQMRDHLDSADRLFVDETIEFLDTALVENDAYTADLQKQDDLKIISYHTPSGDLIINLPDDARPGDTLSGSVIPAPRGRTRDERAQNLAILENYFVTVQDADSADGTLSFLTQPDAPFFIEDPYGQVIEDIPISVVESPDETSGTTIVEPQTETEQTDVSEGKTSIAESTPEKEGTPAEGKTPATSGEESQPKVSETPTGTEPTDMTSFPCDPRLRFGQAGWPSSFHGPFDGDFDTTDLRIGHLHPRLLAESPRKVVFENPANFDGSTMLVIQENGQRTECPYRVIAIGLEADKLHLVRGETTTLRIKVYGLANLTDEEMEQLPVIVLTNQSPDIISIDGGNQQTLLIQPEKIGPKGVYVIERTLRGVQPGRFGITARLASANNRTEDVEEDSR